MGMKLRLATGTTRNALLLGAAVSALAISASELAQAGSFGIREQSPTAQGAAYAGVAAGEGGLSAMFWNPATLTDNPGWQNQWGVSGILPYATITAVPPTPTLPLGNSGDIGLGALVPATYSSYQVNDWLWAGLAFNAPFGLATKSNLPWAGQLYGRTSEVRTIDISPTLAIKVNDWLSFGASFEAMYFKTRLTSALGLGAAPPIATLQGDSWGYGFTAGVTLKPFAGTEIGIGYRSQIRENLSGTFTNDIGIGPLPASALVGGAYGIRSNLTLPDSVTIGLRQRVTPDLTLLAGLEWTHWGAFKSFPVVLTSPAPFAGANLTPLAFRYKDGWYVSGGAEYKWNPDLTLRAGLAYEKSPINDTNRGVRLPDNDRVWASIGAGYRFSRKLSIDVSYAHAFVKNGRVIIAGPANPAFNPALPPFFGNSRGHFDILSAALNYRWDDPAVTSDGPPKGGALVRKY